MRASHTLRFKFMKSDASVLCLKKFSLKADIKKVNNSTMCRENKLDNGLYDLSVLRLGLIFQYQC